MPKNNNPQQEQNHDSTERAELQNSGTRKFVEDHTGTSVNKGPVSEGTARVADDQNRLITQQNLRK